MQKCLPELPAFAVDDLADDLADDLVDNVWMTYVICVQFPA